MSEIIAGLEPWPVIKIPALADGSGLAANGLPISNEGGYVHNGCEVSIKQTDLNINNIFWMNTTTTELYEKSYEELLNHDGSQNVIVNVNDSGMVEYINTIQGELIFATRDGIYSTIAGNVIETDNAIVGNNIVLTNGSMRWETAEVVSYIYIFDPQDGTGATHYADCNGTKYINSVETVDVFPFVVTSTGVSNVTGAIHKIEVYNNTRSQDQILEDYIKEARFW